MGYIKPDFIDQLIDKSDILDIVSIYSDCKAKGKHHFCKSPFKEENTPSFCVDTTKQRFVDYSTDKNGDVITFIMEKESLSYPEAIEWLAKHYGMPVQYEKEEWTHQKQASIKKKESLRPLLMSTAKKYTGQLRSVLESDNGHPAALELQKRQYTSADISDWGLGFAPGERFIYDQVKQINRKSDAQDLFLIGDKWDKYWNRLIIPIHDVNGLLIGFAGRDLDNDPSKKSAKWINPADTPLYKKDKTWFALHRAKDAIRKTGEAWLMEGYNDVIAWHKNGLTNTISPCGTAITESQIHILSRFCKKVVFCFDADKAGMKAVIKNLPLFITKGFDVEVVYLPMVDPDDFSRIYKSSIAKYGLSAMMSEQGVRRRGFMLLLNHHIHGNIEGASLSNASDIEKGKGAKELIKIACSVQDEAMQEIYMGWIAQESGIKRTVIDKWAKSENEDLREKSKSNYLYQIPKQIGIPLPVLLPDIQKYRMFIANDQIWMLTDGYTFESVSNFSVEIIQHMKDEKFPMKLLRIKNIYGDEVIFDTMSENLNNTSMFDKVVTDQGNFIWDGSTPQFKRLRKRLFDKMGVGRKIEVLGWQPENFWVWNNGVTTPGEEFRTIDNNGVYKYSNDNKTVSCYVPSANQVYSDNGFKFIPQKKVALHKSNYTFNQYADQLIKVHLHHGITGILFTVSTMFLDIVEDILGNFPLMFLYGPASSGKDQLTEACQSFFGVPQSAINIESGVSTAKASVRKFAQFRNMIVHLSEYPIGDPKLDGMLKGFWDRRGYERGSIESAYATDVIPLTSSVWLTSNYYPINEALQTRCIISEMTKTEFTNEEGAEYVKLKEMYKSGISSLTADILHHRKIYAKNFKSAHRMVKETLKTEVPEAGKQDRMLSNMAVLGATYHLLKDVVQFPFTWRQFMNNSKKLLETQTRKMRSAGTLSKFWDCFLAVIRTNQDTLKHGREFELKDDTLYLSWRHTYNRVRAQWYGQYGETAVDKTTIIDSLKKDDCWKGPKHSHRMPEAKTSVIMIDATKLEILSDLQEAIEWQKMQGTDVPAKDENQKHDVTLPPPGLFDSTDNTNPKRSNNEF